MRSGMSTITLHAMGLARLMETMSGTVNHPLELVVSMDMEGATVTWIVSNTLYFTQVACV